MPFEYATCAKAFNIFLTRSENNKPKPVRGLLITLTSLLSKHPVQDVKLSLIAHAVRITTRLICKPDEAGSIKAAIQLLEHFLATGIVDAFQISRVATSQKPQQNQPISAPRVIGDSEYFDAVQDFTTNVLKWVQYPDCAPAIGRFLPALFGAIGHAQNQEAHGGLSHMTLPWWIAPVKQCVERNRSLLEVYENHVLPGLLRMSLADRQAFVETLPLRDIQQACYGSHTIADIELCILVARIESSSKVESSKTSREKAVVETVSLSVESSKQAAVEGDVRIDAQRLAMNLLEHPVSTIRMASFSLLVSSSGSKRVPSKTVFQCLQHCIPYFHVEVNAKARNEFIALTKKLCVFLRGASVLLIRECEGAFYIADRTHCAPQADSPTGKLYENDLPLPLQDCLNFQIWYTKFLAHELQPTASYQSHITALNILHSLLDDQESLMTNTSKASQKYRRLLEKWLPSDLMLRPLLDLMLDPFDDVRRVANMLVRSYLTMAEIGPSLSVHVDPKVEERSCGNGNSALDICEEIRAALKKAEPKAAETGRADHADGVGRLYALLYKADNASALLDNLTSQLVEEIGVAKRNLQLAVQSASLHGHLIALR